MEDSSTVEKLMDEELKNRFNHPWIRLDRGSKMNRIYLFVKHEKNNRKKHKKYFIYLLLTSIKKFDVIKFIFL